VRGNAENQAIRQFRGVSRRAVERPAWQVGFGKDPAETRVNRYKPLGGKREERPGEGIYEWGYTIAKLVRKFQSSGDNAGKIHSVREKGRRDRREENSPSLAPKGLGFDRG